jgi:4-hydroxythreonine-4-phosphate dehydrogenase
MFRPRIAVTVGDPRGIGPEVVVKALAADLPPASIVAIGPAPLIEALPAAESLGVGEAGPVAARSASGAALTLDVTPEHAGLSVRASIEAAVRMALAGEVHAIVTGPADKRALHLAGIRHPGHTEWLAELAGGVEVAMMLVAGGLRVVLITTHLPLRDVPDAVTASRIVATGHLTRRALDEWWGIEDPRLALCALNPHAGDGGLFGTEDDDVLAPAAAELDAAGPFPADTVFVRALRGEFDAVLVPFHDVGMTAVKVAGFGTGVNVTLGLPFIRTAPDHGTALDIAGQGIAEAGSIAEAVRLAITLARRREGS